MSLSLTDNLLSSKWSGTSVECLFVESVLNASAGCGDNDRKKTRVGSIKVDDKEVGIFSPRSSNNNCGVACLKKLSEHQSQSNSLRKAVGLPMATHLSPNALETIAVHVNIRIRVHKLNDAGGLDDIFLSPIGGHNDDQVDDLLLIDRSILGLAWTSDLSEDNAHYAIIDIKDKRRGAKRRNRSHRP
jgi:hypothetical protein